MRTTTKNELFSPQFPPDAEWPRAFQYICVPADSKSFGMTESIHGDRKFLEIPRSAEIVKLEGDEQPEMQYPSLLLVRLEDGTELAQWNIVGRPGTALERVNHEAASQLYTQQRAAFLDRFPLRANRGGLAATHVSKGVA